MEGWLLIPYLTYMLLNNNESTTSSNEILSEDELYKIKKAALVFRALNHHLRQKMLALIKNHKVINVTDIFVALRIEQSVASQHLHILKRAGIVSTLRKGKKIFYSIDFERLDSIVSASHGLIHFPDLTPIINPL